MRVCGVIHSVTWQHLHLNSPNFMILVKAWIIYKQFTQYSRSLKPPRQRPKERQGCVSPPMHSNRIRGYLCSFPHHLNLLSWERYTSPISGIGNHRLLSRKTHPFPGFLGKSSQDKRPQNTRMRPQLCMGVGWGVSFHFYFPPLQSV